MIASYIKRKLDMKVLLLGIAFFSLGFTGGAISFHYKHINQSVHGIASVQSTDDEKENFQSKTIKDDITMVVNKDNELDQDYVPKDLRTVNVNFSFKGNSEEKTMRDESATALETMIKDSQKAKVNLIAVSAYRSYKNQENIYNNSVKIQGKDHADKFSAEPGKSEHQSGLSIDLSCNFVGNKLVQNFDKTKEGIWLKNNCYLYGFIIRYPKDKEKITGYSYEPWHIRYVGKIAAKEIKEKNLSLEEYVDNLSKK